jgi:hypothetical protein
LFPVDPPYKKNAKKNFFSDKETNIAQRLEKGIALETE